MDFKAFFNFQVFGLIRRGQTTGPPSPPTASSLPSSSRPWSSQTSAWRSWLPGPTERSTPLTSWSNREWS